MWSQWLYLFAALNTFQRGNALPKNRTDASVNAAIDAGTFKTPSANVRPRFRYWVPDASVDSAILAADVKSAGDVGAGGVEVLGYYNYGGTAQGTGNFTPSDWTIYGWGTPAWQQSFKALAQAHAENGLIMDFAMGPNQGQGVPAPEGSDGLAWDLFSYNISVPIGGSFNDSLPGLDLWGLDSLHAVIIGTVVRSENITDISSDATQTGYNSTGTYPSLPGDAPDNRTQYTLGTDSLEVVTDQVTDDGRLDLQFSSNSTGIENNIFVIYQIHSDFRAQQSPADEEGPETQPQTWQQNGSWAVDHYSALGAQTMTNFWEQYVLTNGTRELVMEVGNYGWEDSIEIRSNIQWTKAFPSVFSATHGYDLTKYLPILFHQNHIEFNGEYPIWWITDEADSGDTHIADYRKTVGDLYGVYVETLNN